jgi:hypothetical protein
MSQVSSLICDIYFKGKGNLKVKVNKKKSNFCLFALL